jgi:hypothetical protein
MGYELAVLIRVIRVISIIREKRIYLNSNACPAAFLLGSQEASRVMYI